MTRKTSARAALALAAIALAAPAAAFERLADQGSFLSVVQGRTLNMMGISLSVLPDGRIEGRAMGREVTGRWQWQDGYFCRDLAWGRRDLGYNCQTVAFDGRKMRFQADRGTGDSADMTVR